MQHDLPPNFSDSITSEYRNPDAESNRGLERIDAPARAKKIQPQQLIDRRYLEEMERSGFFDSLWKK
ncbi:MAG TPA: hypothetical protein VEB61_08315 [Candidatus Binatia bacterium]|nr:hypothetical protein [Candidatus Binatia bacterium]